MSPATSIVISPELFAILPATVIPDELIIKGVVSRLDEFETLKLIFWPVVLWSIKAPPLDLNLILFSAKIESFVPTKTCELASNVPVTSTPVEVVLNFSELSKYNSTLSLVKNLAVVSSPALFFKLIIPCPSIFKPPVPFSLI